VPRWAWITIIGVPIFVCSCLAIGYFGVSRLIDHGRDGVSEQMAETITASVAKTSTVIMGEPSQFVIRESGLDVNNAMAMGEVGIDTGTNGTLIYGFVTEIDTGGISLLAGDAVAYSGVPTVRNGTIDLTDAKALVPFLNQILTAGGFEQAMETGINRAIAARGMAPVSLTLSNGVLIIVVEPATSTPEIA
jgi:hypothetical protein